MVSGDIREVLKLKLAVNTGPAQTQACSVTCDPYQPTKFKGYRRVLLFMGAGHLIHCVCAL